MDYIKIRVNFFFDFLQNLSKKARFFSFFADFAADFLHFCQEKDKYRLLKNPPHGQARPPLAGKFRRKKRRRNLRGYLCSLSLKISALKAHCPAEGLDAAEAKYFSASPSLPCEYAKTPKWYAASAE